MSEDTCKLCLQPATDISDPILSFGEALPANSTATEAEGTPVQYTTVADVLLKHFRFELNFENDATAFVCRPCWTKVDDFHRFYETVLLRYESIGKWQRKCEPVQELLESKFEIVLHGNNDGQTPDCKDEVIRRDSTADENEEDSHWQPDDDDEDDDDEAEDIHAENHIKTEESETPSALSPEPQIKRKRGRPRKCVPADSTPDPTADADATTDDLDHSLLVQYFTLKCDLCAAPLPDLQAARTHYQTVHQLRGYLLCGCGQRFVRAATIREHCAFHADPSEHKCIECCKIYATANRLTSHRRYKHKAADEAKFEHDDAAEELDEKGAYNSLARQRRDDALLRAHMSLVCGVCGVAFATFAEARQHHQQVHQQRGYLECCGKRFFKKCRAVQHCQWHANPQQFDCKVCGRNFAGIVSLREHIVRRHPTDEPFIYQCDRCDSSFQLQAQLRYHQERVHTPPEAKRYECYRCHRRYMFMSQLRSHMRDVHEPRGPSHVCDICAKYFKSKATYELHYAVEHGTVSLKQQCPECGKWLKHAGMVARHMKQHRAEPTPCVDCGHVAPGARALYSHRRLVHGTPKHKCMVCGKMFKKLLTLREHMAIHAGITDLYTCAYCPKTFRSISNMYKHRRQTHAAQFEVDRVAAKLASDRRNAEETLAAGGTVVPVLA